MRKNWHKFVLCWEARYISESLLITVTCLSRIFFRIVGRSSTHTLQLDFVIVFIAQIGLSYFTTLNGMHLRGSVREVVDLKCGSKWSENESYFCLFLIIYIYIYISNQTLWPLRILIVRRWGFKPRAESRGALDSAPNVSSRYSNSYALVLLTYILLFLHPCHFRRPCLNPYPLQVQVLLLPPPLLQLIHRALLRS